MFAVRLANPRSITISDIRIPFRVDLEGLYTFRYHMDMGLGSFMGIDGPEFRPGNTWGHVETGGHALLRGDHEWEVLGFEDCCDGHAELEVHLPCEARAGTSYLSATNDPACPAGALCAMTQGIYAPGKREYVTVAGGRMTVEHYNPDHCCTGTATRTAGTEADCTGADSQWCAWAGEYLISYDNGFTSTHTITKEGLVSADNHDGLMGNAPWRIVRHGSTACLTCGGGPDDVGEAMSCSTHNTAAACCRQEGNGCGDQGLDAFNTGEYGAGSECSIGGDMVCTSCDDPNLPPSTAHVGRFMAAGQAMSFSAAVDYCEEHHQSLASVHSWEEQQQAVSACMAYADPAEVACDYQGTNCRTWNGETENYKYGCWIGFVDLGQEGGFVWLDGSSVDFVDWAPVSAAPFCGCANRNLLKKLARTGRAK